MINQDNAENYLISGRPLHRCRSTRISIILCLLLCLLFYPACAEPITDQNLLARLAAAPGVKDYPQDDAVWLLRDTQVTVEDTGALTVRERKLVKLLTDRALPLAQWEIPYDKSTTKLEVVTARTIFRDRAFPIEPGQVAESAIYPGVAWYDSLVVRRFPLSGAAVDAVLEVETVSRRAAPRLAGDLSARFALQHVYPIREESYTIRVPASWRLAIRFPGVVKPEVREREEKGARIYAWTAHDVPALRLTEPQAPPADDLLATARVASLPNWEPVVTWYTGLTAGKDAVTDTVRAVAERLTKDCATPGAKISVLHKAAREVPYVAMEMGSSADTPHSADEVLRQNYGDCKDKATLLKALLKAAGIESDYVLVRTTDRGQLDRALYGPGEYNHVILAARLPEGVRYLDATMQDVPVDLLPPGVEGAEGLIIRDKGELAALPSAPAARNLTDIAVTVVVKADGSATGTAVLTLDGQQAIVQRSLLRPVKEERYREALEAVAPLLGSDVAVQSATIDGLREPERPLKITVEFTSAAYIQEAGPQLCGMLPVFMYQPNRYLTIKTRTLPFQQRLVSTLRETAVITLPKEYQVTYLPPAANYAGIMGEYHDTCASKDGVISFRCDLSTKRGLFPSDALPEFRAWSSILALEKRSGLQFYVKKAE